MRLRYLSTRYEALQVRNDAVVSFCPVPYSAKIDLPVDNACDHQQGIAGESSRSKACCIREAGRPRETSRDEDGMWVPGFCDPAGSRTCISATIIFFRMSRLSGFFRTFHSLQIVRF